MAPPDYEGQVEHGTYLTSPENSTPREVRNYLVSLLVHNHDCYFNDAKDIASAWIYDRGSDFHQYDLEMFKEMFADEAGMLFYLYSRGLTPGGRFGSAWAGEVFIAIHYSQKEIDRNE